MYFPVLAISAWALLAQNSGSITGTVSAGPAPRTVDPTWMGHSIGHWEGDTLVVDSVGFNGRAWIDLEGHPFTEKTHITERWRRPDLGHLEVEFTIDDPSSYVKPWTIKRISDLAPKGEEVAEYICTENNKDVPHLVGK